MGNVIVKREPSIEARHCTLIGLYKNNSKWDPKLIKRFVLEKKLAPIFVGVEDKVSYDHEECPICFLFYPGGLNRTRCCKQSICTECYLQMKTPNVPATCPFCNHERFSVVFRGPKSFEEKAEEERERQKVLKLQEKMRREEQERSKKRELERQESDKDAATLTIDDSETNADTNVSFDFPLTFEDTSQAASPNFSHFSRSFPNGNNFEQREDAGETGQRDSVRLANESTSSNAEQFTSVTAMEERMIAEAIRLSLLDVHESSIPTSSSMSPSVPPDNTTSSSSSTLPPPPEVDSMAESAVSSSLPSPLDQHEDDLIAEVSGSKPPLFDDSEQKIVPTKIERPQYIDWGDDQLSPTSSSSTADTCPATPSQTVEVKKPYKSTRDEVMGSKSISATHDPLGALHSSR